MMVSFLTGLPFDVSSDKLGEIDNAFGLSVSKNAEIGREWFTQVARRRHTDAYEAMEQHLNRHGRTWLLRDTYRGLVENGEDAELAKTIYDNAKHAYHPITRMALEKILSAESTTQD